MCRCHIPTAVVAQRGLFRILLGDPVSVSNVSDKGAWVSGPSGTGDFEAAQRLASRNADLAVWRLYVLDQKDL